MELVIVSNFELPAAGRTWIVPDYRSTRLRDGSLGVPRSEFRRIHLAIAAAVCGVPGPMSPVEFEFLCDIADVPYARVAEMVGLDRSAITKWMEREHRPMRVDRSNLWKRWFLFRLFGDAIRRHAIPTDALALDSTVLPLLRREIVRSGATFDIGERGGVLPPASKRIAWAVPDEVPVEAPVLRLKSQEQREEAREARHVA